MTNSTRKSKRSEFFHSLSLIGSSNPLRTARIDTWGAVSMVVAFGMIAKLAQTLLSH
jgi:hypothetical protein